ncbi:hypothetical protein B0T26DRAFT_755738 [Lasiosphaeria miniovina]|uniref:Uncharacterized protein n=1 Tax=Lasiosphaeria miniovina TaxID=1954250 RepID=A0AA39ZYY2_9PEZI|nr:uncharacterized protein B0T26DRAFT_755738 [Lasiosphaeria miniovina]KAK0706217.1 hypothetical protein B0T26DRAFT_755738 [Lasiosphaeria miniovina]
MDPITWVPLIVGAAVKGPEIIRFGREIINTKKSLDEVRLYQRRCDTYLREVKAENDELRREGRIPPALRNETRNLIRYCRGMVNGVAQYHDDYVHKLSIRLLHVFAMPVRNQSRYYSHRLDECRTWLAIAVAANFLHANFDAAYAGDHYALAECRNRAQALRDAFDQARQYQLRYPRRARHMMAEVDLGVFWRFEYLGNLELFAKPQASTLSIATTLPNGLASSIEALGREGQRANSRNRDLGINIVDARPPPTEHWHRDYALGRREDGTTSPLVEVRDFSMGPPSAVPLPLRVDRGKQAAPLRRGSHPRPPDSGYSSMQTSPQMQYGQPASDHGDVDTPHPAVQHASDHRHQTAAKLATITTATENAVHRGLDADIETRTGILIPQPLGPPASGGGRPRCAPVQPAKSTLSTTTTAAARRLHAHGGRTAGGTTTITITTTNTTPAPGPTTHSPPAPRRPGSAGSVAKNSAAPPRPAGASIKSASIKSVTLRFLLAGRMGGGGGGRTGPKKSATLRVPLRVPLRVLLAGRMGGGGGGTGLKKSAVLPPGTRCRRPKSLALRGSEGMIMNAGGRVTAFGAAGL